MRCVRIFPEGVSPLRAVETRIVSKLQAGLPWGIQWRGRSVKKMSGGHF